MDARKAWIWIFLLMGSVACGDDDNESSGDAAVTSADAGEDSGSNRGSAGRGSAGRGSSPRDSGSNDDDAPPRDGGTSTESPSSSRDAAPDPSEPDEQDEPSEPEPGTVDEDAGEPQPAVPADYSKAENWLCRPDHNDTCTQNLDATIVRADGSSEVERYTPNPDAPIDCFYVYPTVSLDPTPNSDFVPGDEEINVVRAQFARFGTQCRLFAPIYRQVTLTALRASLGGMMSTADRMLGYSDVLAAWQHYLETYNEGRGVVLVGHSQGSGVLLQLLREQLDKQPVDSRLISAFIIGANTLVPKDQLVGGTLQQIPLCASDSELGCLVTYASFRANTPPAATALFGNSTDPNLVAACNNPAAPGGGSGELHAYLNANGPGTSATPMPVWAEGLTVETPYVSVPGMLSAECKFATTGSYLAVTVQGNPDDPRVDDIVGDVVADGMVSADWGLHLIDVHLALGNLIDLVRIKSNAYLQR